CDVGTSQVLGTQSFMADRGEAETLDVLGLFFISGYVEPVGLPWRGSHAGGKFSPLRAHFVGRNDDGVFRWDVVEVEHGAPLGRPRGGRKRSWRRWVRSSRSFLVPVDLHPPAAALIHHGSAANLFSRQFLLTNPRAPLLRRAGFFSVPAEPKLRGYKVSPERRAARNLICVLYQSALRGNEPSA